MIHKQYPRSSIDQWFSDPCNDVAFKNFRIQLNSTPQLVDGVIPNIEITHFDDHEEDSDISYKPLDPTENLTTRSLDIMDCGSGVLHVWHLLIEGLAGCCTYSSRKYQPHCLDTLFGMLRSLMDVPGIPNNKNTVILMSKY